MIAYNKYKPESTVPIIAHTRPAFMLLYDDGEYTPGLCWYKVFALPDNESEIIPSIKPGIPTTQQKTIDKIPITNIPEEFGNEGCW